MPDDPDRELVLAVGEGIEGGLGAAQAARDLVEGQVGEALGEEQVGQPVEQVELSSRGDAGHAGILPAAPTIATGRIAILAYRLEYHSLACLPNA